MFNPLHILGFQLPRHYLGIVFFLLALYIGGKSKWVYSIFSIFSQNIIGVYIFGFLILSKLRGLYLIIGFFGFFMCYYIIATDCTYNMYLEDEELRGRGQLIYLLSFLPIYAFITKKNKASWLLVFGLTLTTIVIYSFSQVAYRFFEICLILAFFYAMKEVHGKYHKLIIRSYVAASSAITACVVYLGLYGYGI